uniref:Uncharacterized protein n=3 Tax=Oryza TaxID=4527 RepID=Q6H518_ORYSJ|nr:hypothetical protein [Oryza sativa Japonica Group]BAD26181.1 hypothetical protein [Oryza sativa Japonica Group]
MTQSNKFEDLNGRFASLGTRMTQRISGPAHQGPIVQSLTPTSGLRERILFVHPSARCVQQGMAGSFKLHIEHGQKTGIPDLQWYVQAVRAMLAGVTAFMPKVWIVFGKLHDMDAWMDMIDGSMDVTDEIIGTHATQ